MKFETKKHFTNVDVIELFKKNNIELTKKSAIFGSHYLMATYGKNKFSITEKKKCLVVIMIVPTWVHITSIFITFGVLSIILSFIAGEGVIVRGGILGFFLAFFIGELIYRSTKKDAIEEFNSTVKKILSESDL